MPSERFLAREASNEETDRLIAARAFWRQQEQLEWRPDPIGGYLDRFAGIDPSGASAQILSAEPLVIYTNLEHGRPLGIASAWDLYDLGQGIAPNQPVYFLVPLWWTIDSDEAIDWIRLAALSHRDEHPNHVFVFLCNTEAERDRLLAAGECAILFNHNLTQDWSDFTADRNDVKYDAIYNARLTPWKRHYLTMQVERCAFIYYRAVEDPAVEETILSYHRDRAPGHVFLNGRTGSRITKLSAREVNSALGRSGVGLCLSESEGAMFASIEYLFAGLPVVSTHNVGGRDRYLHADFSITCDASARDVAAAVSALRVRNIPRDHIRKVTIEHIRSDRRAFLQFLSDLYEECGLELDPVGEWPFGNRILKFRPWSDHRAMIGAATDHAVFMRRPDNRLVEDADE